MEDEELKRARPVLLSGGQTKLDHLFRDGKSLCGVFKYRGGRTVKEEAQGMDDADLCPKCVEALNDGE